MPRKYVRKKPLPTKEWTEQQIDRFFEKKKVKHSILDVKIDETRSDMISTDDLKKIYDKYKIKYFSKKQDFVTFKL